MAFSFVPILILMIFAAALAAGLLLLGNILGTKVRTRRKLSTYECGMPPLDRPHKRISVKFFVVAMIFILFDVEIAFVYPWAAAFRSGGRPFLIEMLIFLFTLGVGYAYVWKKGAFDW
jgi:NADH-quinone oxidoreductase subunit A